MTNTAQTNTTVRLLHNLCSILRILIALTLFAFLLLLHLGNARTASADNIPGGNVADAGIRAVDIAKPAVVRIFTTVNGRLLVTFPTGTISFPLTGNGYQLGLSGSGTFISARGDVLTADHVINPPAKDPGVDQAFDDLAAQDVTNYANQHNIYGKQVTQDQIDQALRSNQIQSQPKFDSVNSEVFLSTDYTGALTATSLQDVPSELHAPVDKIEQESSFNQADVAIVHAQFDDTPSIQLGDSSTVQQQDQLKIIGFPGNGDVSSTPTNLLTSSINIVNVSSIKTTDNGAQVIQVGGNVEHGDSGGPALDSNGHVVGIVSFGLADAAGTSFLQASNSARTLVQKQGLNVAPSTFEKLWNQTFTDYAATTPGHWHKAQQGFQQLAKSYPLFKAITPYLNYATTQAATEKVPQSQATPTGATNTPVPTTSSSPIIATVLTIAGVVVLLALVVLLVRTGTRRGKTNKAAQKQPGMAHTGPIVAPPPGGMGKSNMGQGVGYNAGMSAFGAPPPSMQSGIPGTVPVAASTPAPTISQVLRPWPCGHVNRPEAKFCTICGEPAPTRPPTRLSNNNVES